MEPISIYIHIPLCVQKCAYCDFTSFAGRLQQREAYVQAVLRELRAQAAFFGAHRVGTVFMGGGTPTLLSGEQVAGIMDTIRACFSLDEDAEVTMEGNPGTLTRENLAAYRRAGINRLSLGVQSLDDGLLRTVGRIHTAEEAVRAVRMAREAGFQNLNLDLMNGLPGQSADQWAQTLRRAVELQPEHLSCYGLILEEGTPLEAAVKAGSCPPLPDEDTLETMDALTREMTAAAGYERYEVSNYAKPGRACRHNIVYWECLPYLGVGCAAHSDMDGHRFYNPEGWEDYMGLSRGEESLRRREGEDAPGERRFERMMMGLRMARGVDCARFTRDFGAGPEAYWPRSMERLGALFERGEGRLRLTERGMQVMNGVLVEMLEEQNG
ncbi:MAG: radical SAM family heme chaperone HemW [Clostridia bacterium]|nr:radical SAM family heme chaperone HemW [Clostridia bacterium]